MPGLAPQGSFTWSWETGHVVLFLPAPAGQVAFAAVPYCPTDMGTKRAHRWIQQTCTRCGLRCRETWVVDRAGREVMALVWTGRTGDQRVQPFPPMKGLEPSTTPVLTLEVALPGVPVGPEPPCRRPPRVRGTKRPESDPLIS